MATRSSRKRAKGSDSEETSLPKKSKNVQWEWLGDGNKWTPYSDDFNEKLTDWFTRGVNEVTAPVAEGVKMKITYKKMSQSNVKTGWSRAVRCVPSDDPNYKSSVWEWEDSDGVWKKYPENTNRCLDAAELCGLNKFKIDISGQELTVDLSSKDMEDDKAEKHKIRRLDPDEIEEEEENDTIWQWKDDKSGWNNYSDSDSRLIESSYAAGTVAVNMAAGGWSYSLDLMKMEQTNTRTKKVRKIRRVPKSSAHVATKKATAAKDVVKVSMSVGVGGRVSKVVRRTPRESKKAISTVATTRGKKKPEPEEAEPEEAEPEEEESEEEEEVKSKLTTASTGSTSIKSQVYSGGAPVDSECTQKIGKAKVYTDSNGDIWNSMLNQTNLKNNNNKFYLLQLLVDNNKPSYSVWFRWGRVGKTGQHQLHSFGSDLESAKDTFCKKFIEKTNNHWADRRKFKKVPGKYDLLEMDYEPKTEEEDTDAPLTDDLKLEQPESKLDERVQKLIEMICNIQSMEDVIKEMKYDTKKAPLGKLTTSQIKFGFAALKKIESLIEANNIKGDSIYEACNDFYTRIPHDFGMTRPPLITTREEIKEKLALLEALSDIQIAMTILQKTDKDDIHPIDRHYNELSCTITPLSADDEMYNLIRKNIKQTHGKTHANYTLDVEEIFEISKDKESKKFKDVGNRQLLWHGSRLTNWMGILSQGLRIAPPEAPVTGYMFGKGVYFADICSKSANYCFATPSRPTGLLLLSEVSLGTPNELLAANYQANRLPKGTQSVKGCGRVEPDPAHNHTFSDGTILALGTPTDTGVHNKGGYTLNYSEYIVYDTSQIKMRYLVQLKFNFK